MSKPAGAPKPPADAAEPKLHVKIRLAGGVVGPGKIALLDHIRREGSISAAARGMGMSFRRAWHLIDTLNQAVGRPVVETSVGGSRGGGARLTDFGDELVERYQRTLQAVDADAAALLEWIADPADPAQQQGED